MGDNADYVPTLRKLAAHAAYAVDGVWPQFDPFPDRLDELCEGLRRIGNGGHNDGSIPEED